MSPYQQWCIEHNCGHAHCPVCSPLGEHPQAFVYDGTLYCGRCLFIDDKATEMIACNPENCNE